MRPTCFRPGPDRGRNNNPVKTQEIDLYLARRDVVFPEIRDRDAAQVCDNALSHPRLKRISQTSLIFPAKTWINHQPAASRKRRISGTDLPTGFWVFPPYNPAGLDVLRTNPIAYCEWLFSAATSWALVPAIGRVEPAVTGRFRPKAEVAISIMNAAKPTFVMSSSRRSSFAANVQHSSWS